MNIVGSYLRAKREEAGLSQRALGQLFEPQVTTQFISNIERGATPLPPVHIPTLARSLKFSESELLSVMEREYASKISSKLHGTIDPERGNPFQASVRTTDEDRFYFQALYDAYRLLEGAHQEAFQSVCETLLQVPKPQLPKPKPKS